MKPAPKSYLKTQVETATKPQLLIMLFDGAIRFSERAKVDLMARNYESSHEGLVRSQRIVLELWMALDSARVGNELYANLAGLYGFIYRRLVSANMRRNPQLVDEALEILRHLRETWIQAVEKMDPETKKALTTQSVAPMEARTLSVRG